MDRLIYTAMTAIQQLDSKKLKNANELANSTTFGFKDTFNFATQTAKIAGPGFNSRFVPMNRSNDEINLKPGPVVVTQKKLDIYMRGSTVLGVQTSNGNTAFTRRGDLTVDSAGLLATGNGHTVLGEGGGPIPVPLGVELSIADDGSVLASDLTVPEAPPAVVGNLLLRDSEGTRLVRRADGLFEALGAGGLGGDIESGPTPPSVQSGAVEGSTVNVADKLINFMDMSRSFEMRIKMIAEMQELDDSGATMMRFQ